VASKATVLVCIQQMEGGRKRGTGPKGLCRHSAHIPWIRAPSLGHTYLQKEAGKCNLRVSPEGRENRFGEQPGSV